jgi:DNA polymerase (family X)
VNVLRANHEPVTLPLTNAEVADRLDEVAQLLSAQDADPFRIRAYHNAAHTLRGLKRPAHEMLASEGLSALTALEGIGQSLARAIEQLSQTGRLGLLERLRGEATPEQVFASVPGIGPAMASRIHEQLDIESLPELEAAAYDGRLGQVRGMGRKRIRAVRESLAGRFRRRPRVTESASRESQADQPSVGELLDVDAEYRRKAEAGKLARIAPRRFNPTGQAWLPVLHAKRDSRRYTALYSNTARAHELGTIRDWVVIYRDDDGGHGQWTVVTARFGALAGRRVVRGRELACVQHYGG